MVALNCFSVVLKYSFIFIYLHIYMFQGILVRIITQEMFTLNI